MIVAIRDGRPRDSDSFPCRRLTSVRRRVCHRATAHGSLVLAAGELLIRTDSFWLSVLGELGQAGLEKRVGVNGAVGKMYGLVMTTSSRELDAEKRPCPPFSHCWELDSQVAICYSRQIVVFYCQSYI